MADKSFDLEQISEADILQLIKQEVKAIQIPKASMPNMVTKPKANSFYTSSEERVFFA